MSRIPLPQHFLLYVGLLTNVGLLGGCAESQPSVERVSAFCSGVRAGEQFTEVEARYSQFRLQTGGFAPDPGVRLEKSLPLKERQKITGILAEPEDSWSGERAVCAIYYSDPFLEGNGKVVLAEFKAAWAHSY
jgi:hypothetical protein